MAGNQALHTLSFAKQFKPVDGFKFQRVTFSRIPVLRFSATQVPSVVVERHSIDMPQLARSLAHDFCKKLSRPIPIVRVWAGSDQFQFVAIGRKPRGIAPKLDSVLLRSEVTAASPRFVSDAPILHMEWLAVTCRRPRVRKSCASRGRITVFHPLLES